MNWRRGFVVDCAAMVAVIATCVSLGPVAALGVHVLDGADIPKYVDPLVIPPVMKPMGQGGSKGMGNAATQYQIAVRQFGQQVLPTGWPMTTVWGYGRKGDPLPGPGVVSSFNFPGFTVEARVNERVRVRWINQLVDDPDSPTPQYLAHLLSVDQTLHWANPPGPPDTRGTDTTPYTGPVPIVVHLHGAHTGEESDGYPEAWYLPNAANTPVGYWTQGSHYGGIRPAPPGSAWFEYPNDQRATTLWYHDHALGITRLNVYAGLAGFWLLRDDIEDSLNLPGPAPKLGDPPGTTYYEIPIAIQDRTFYDDGSLFYPDTREYFDGFPGPYIPDSDVSPIWNPEFFGNTMVANGRTWPYLEVEPRLYRFRLLNGCDSRFLILKFDQEGLTFHQIGSEGGLLPDAPVELEELLIAPAERPDVIVDFSGFEPGDEIILLNVGPDEPFKGPEVEQDPADPDTTGQVMKFVVVPYTGMGNDGEIPAELPAIEPLATDLPPRDLTLNEEVNEEFDIPIAAKLGTLDAGPLTWSDLPTETPTVNTTEQWNIINLTEDAHPIHLHLVMFQVVERQAFDVDEYEDSGEIVYSGDAMPPEAWETGWKDTVVANPGEITRVRATFDLVGLFVWHCHILSHEDNEMMRPYRVVPAE